MGKAVAARAQALIQKYFPRDQWANAYRVMQAESGADPGAHNTKGEDSRGLFQINVVAAAHPDLARHDLFDPETNVRLAAQIYQESGWRPWTTAVAMGLGEGGSSQVSTPVMQNQGTTPTTLPKTLTAAELEQIAREHGGHKAQIAKPQTPREIASGAPAHITFVFEDGTSLEVTWHQDQSTWVVENWSTVGKQRQAQATAQQAQARAEAAAPLTAARTAQAQSAADLNEARAAGEYARQGLTPAERGIVVDGSYYEPVPIQNSEGQRIGRTWKLTIPGPGKPPVLRQLGQSVYKETPDGRLEKVMDIPISPQEALGLERARRALLPEQEQLLDNHYRTIDWIQSQIASGQMTPADANRYMTLLRSQTETALQGTTPFQQEQADRRYQQEQQRLGESILGQRLTTGANLGQHLLTGALGAYGRILPGTGAPPMMDPLALAKAFTTDMGGGQGVSDFGRALLMGAGAGAQSTGRHPTTPEDVARIYPELAGGPTNAAAPVPPGVPAEYSRPEASTPVELLGRSRGRQIAL